MPYLLTFSTYGSYLPGDCRGSTDRHIGWRGAEPRLEEHVRKTMSVPSFQLSRHHDRRAVRDAIVELCAQKGWWLAALHVRTNHLHMVVDADAAPERILQACKAYATRALKGLYEAPRNKEAEMFGDWIVGRLWQAPFTTCWTVKVRRWKYTLQRIGHNIPPFSWGAWSFYIFKLKCLG